MAREARTSAVWGVCLLLKGACPAGWRRIEAADLGSPADPLGSATILVLRERHGRLHLVIMLGTLGHVVARHVILSLPRVLLAVVLLLSGWPRYALVVKLLRQPAVDEADILAHGLLLLGSAV